MRVFTVLQLLQNHASVEGGLSKFVQNLKERIIEKISWVTLLSPDKCFHVGYQNNRYCHY